MKKVILATFTIVIMGLCGISEGAVSLSYRNVRGDVISKLITGFSVNDLMLMSPKEAEFLVKKLSGVVYDYRHPDEAVPLIEEQEQALITTIILSYQQTNGETVNKPIGNFNVDDLKRMLPAEAQSFVEKILGVIPDYNNLNDLSQYLKGLEQAFIGSTDVSRLTNAYLALQTNLNTPGFVEELDKDLWKLLEEAKDIRVRGALAGYYKEKANSSSLVDDYVSAAFWFRMSYIAGDHSSYLDEFNSMISRAARLQNNG
ncbi:MAG: hypothetical protein ACD_21C00266G0008 [uncultured bacterium]|nr:MAG: hypothetical protein ACD_21C00266G0008 [uncultured bacterium]